MDQRIYMAYSNGHVYIYEHESCVWQHTCTCVYTNLHACMCPRRDIDLNIMYPYIYIYIYIYIYTHTHTHTHECAHSHIHTYAKMLTIYDIYTHATCVDMFINASIMYSYMYSSMDTYIRMHNTTHNRGYNGFLCLFRTVHDLMPSNNDSYSPGITHRPY